MARKIMKWGLIACILLASPLVYTEVQAFLTSNGAFPTINAFSAKSKTALAVIFALFNLITAAFTAIITVLPAGFLEPKQPKIIASFFVLLTECLPVYAFFQQPNITAFTTVVMTGQVIAFVLTAFMFAEFGSRLAKKRMWTDA
ncbi:hypothetical protein GEOBRER4_n0381 [Citrifermentans bremense]|uniref:Uncharacterized protein n=1 Tax=Citrifermentans bremense TaxID=60035 RepID=A0A6S6LVE1_9BACT|nr:hypothetical protein [Citrifermentans bremense]BCG45623.1 hypothetical protein GEOBRER4_n0381 [Citrifermentans bremense]